MAARTRERFPSWGLPTILLLLLLGTRWLFLLSACDPEEDRVLSIFDSGGLTWTQGPDRPLYDREELYTGAAAELMRLGPPLPAIAYRFMPYGGGSLWIARAARSLYSVFGASYLVFKGLAVLITILGGVAWWGVVRRWLGSRAALLFAALYLLAPTVLVRTALIAKGDHAEAMAWLGLAAWAASEAAAAGNDRRRTLLSALAGLLVGLGVELTYSTVPVSFAVGGTALLLSRARPRRVWLAAAIGLVLGLVPWMLSMQQIGFGATRVYNRSLGSLVPFSEAVTRLRLTLATGGFASYDLPGPLRSLAGWIWLATWITASILLWRRRSAAGRFRWLLLAGSAAHLLAFWLTAPDASSRYLVPAYPLFLITVAAAVPTDSDSSGRGTARMRRLLLPLPVLACGLAAQLFVWARSDFPASRAPLRGYDWPLLGEVLGTKLTAEGVRQLPASIRPFVWVGYGRRISWMEPATWGDAAAVSGAEAPFVWEGIGVGLVESHRLDLAPAVLRRLGDADRAGLRRGLWRYGEVVFVPWLASGAVDRVRSYLETTDEPDLPECRRSLARTLAMLEVHGAAVPPAVLDGAFALVTREEEAEAMGWALCHRADLRGFGWWSPRGGARAHDWYSDAVSGSDARRAGGAPSRAFWSGAAAAWRSGVEVRTPVAILGRDSGPTRLAQEAAALAAAVGSHHRDLIYRAAGEAAGYAWRDPGSNAVRFASGWPWRQAVPEAEQAAFRDGLISANPAFEW